MPVKRGIQLRRCSLCGKTGHNLAKCSLNIKKNKVKKTAKLSQKTNLSKTGLSEGKIKNVVGKQVLVKFSSNHCQSPHQVNLSSKKISDIWHGVSVYSEKPMEKLVKKNVVDFAGLIKKHNGKQKATVIKNQVDDEFDLFHILEKQNIKIKHSANLSKRKNIMEKIKIKNSLENISKILIKYCKNIKYWILDIVVKEKKNIQYLISNIRQLVSKIHFNYRKIIFATISLLLLISLPFPAVGYYNSLKDTSGRVVKASTNGFLSLQSSTVAAMQSNIKQAEYDLTEALNSFAEATSIVDKEHTALQFVAGLLPVVGIQITSRQHLLVAGQHLALGNTYLVKGIDEAEQTSKDLLIDRLGILSRHLQSAIPQYDEALVDLSAVDNSAIPVEYQQSFNDFKLLFAAFINDMKDMVELSKAVGTIFGNDQFKRYLLVFQNNNELRPTGGFIGSFAVMDVQKGKILNLEIPAGGSYDLQGQLDQFVKPPLPLQLVNKRWEFQDANWFPDFAASAQKLAWFYQHSRFATVDGVIAINASVLERLLRVMGTVEDTQTNLSLNSDDAIQKIQYQVEVNYDKTKNRPKEILSGLAGQFMENFKNLDKAKLIGLLAELHEALQEKEIQVYFTDQSLQEKFRAYGWTGELENPGLNQDYLLVLNTNLQGQKSDAKILQTIEQQTVVDKDGNIIDTVVVHRVNQATPGELFYGGNNVDYLRLYAPKGAELLDAGGFNFPPEDVFYVPESSYQDDSDLLRIEKEVSIHAKTGTRITEEFGKIVFGNWVITPPGQQSDVYFVYKLPFKAFTASSSEPNVIFQLGNLLGINGKASSGYSLLVQKQSGIISAFSSSIIYPDNWTPAWKLNDELNLSKNGATISTALEKDSLYGLVMQKNN